MNNAQHQQFIRRRNRTRVAIGQNKELPRLSVYRSLRHIFVQIIDDQSGKTLACSNDLNLDIKANKTDRAREVGKQIAELAKTKKITNVRFDRGAYKYHGRVAAVAEGARENGLQF